MAEGYKSYRIRTKVGQDAPKVVNVHLDQTYDEFQILSLKIDQENSYNLYESDKGIIVGRVLANGGVGIPNAKVSIFIKTDDTMGIKKHNLYPYSSVNDTDNDRVRYNLLPDYLDEVCHQNVGTFPNKRLVLDNDDVIEIFDRFWKYTTVTNSAGDYMLYGIPTGNQTLHMDVDLSDIGFLSQRPTDMVYKGFNINQFESPTKFKEDTNLNSLAQIKSQDLGVYVYPFWGDTTDDSDMIAVTRCDIQVDYKFEPTCIFMGSIITDTGSNAIGKNCAGTADVGKMSDLVAGEGSIEMIRKTIDNKVEEFQIKGNRVIDGDGVWCYQIPMNLDYVMTDEYGNLVPTDNPDKGIPTRARVRFRISLDDAQNDNTATKRCKYLVPNNPRFDKARYPLFTEDIAHEPDYEFGTNTRDESYCDLFWNKVYTVKNYIPRIQKNRSITTRKHTGIKLINHFGDNNPMPYNNLSIKLSFTYRFICVLTHIFIMLVGFLNNLLSIIGAIPCKIAEFFEDVAGFFRKMRIRIRAFGRTLFDACLGCPIAAVFDAAAKVFYTLVPPCIAISSEFCSEDVTHAYTFYPGCGQKGIANVIGSLANCVWEKTRTQHFEDEKEKQPEDRTSPSNNSSELYNCVESQLADDNDATSFNFQNDWVNGVLYAPLWFRKITPKRRFFFGLFSRSAKDEWCSADHPYNGLARIFNPCAVQHNGKTPSKYKNHEGAERDGYYMASKPDCEYDCHERRAVAPLDYGLIRTRETMLGQTVYYYKPIEYTPKQVGNTSIKTETSVLMNDVCAVGDGGTETVNGTLKLLFATDIVLLGSINECDLNGVPQFFKSLESTTYKLPPNMLFTDNTIIQKFNEDGTLSIEYDQVSTTEMTGNDWGNSNDDMCGQPDGGLFYNIGCQDIQMAPKSCINLKRICEFGVSLDEAKQVPNLEEVEANGDNAYETLRPDGFISKDELYNDNERSMFATMNGNELKTKLNVENGLKEYDFVHLYVNNFDNSLYEVMKQRQTRCNEVTYKYNYNFEEFSSAYYDFRMGKNPFFYDEEKKFPRYENSFYFYFGLKAGKTAIDKFNSQFFAECHNPEPPVSPIGIQTKGNSWCSEINDETGYNENNDGFVKIDLSNIALPCDISIQDNNSTFVFNVNGINDDKIIIENAAQGTNGENNGNTGEGTESTATEEEYTHVCMPVVKDGVVHNICALDNGYYTLTVTDADGEVITTEFELAAPYLKYSTVTRNFKRSENTLATMFPTDSHSTMREKIAKDKTGLVAEGDDETPEEDKFTRMIGGVIVIGDIVNSLTGERLTSYQIDIISINDIDGWPDVTDSTTGRIDHKFRVSIRVENGAKKQPFSPYWLNEDSWDNTNAFVIGVPKGDERYKITITEGCIDSGDEFVLSNNKLIQTVYVGDMTPYKLYINDVIDYDVISHWDSGYKLIDSTGLTEPYKAKLNGSSPYNSATYFSKENFNENWLNISDYDGKNDGIPRYKWENLLSYQKVLKRLNKAILDEYYSEDIPLIGGGSETFPLKTKAQIDNLINVECFNKNAADLNNNNVKEKTYYDDNGNAYKVPYLDGNICNEALEILISALSGKKAIYDESNINGQDAIRTIEEIIDCCNSIIEIKAEFIEDMKKAFWLTCPNESKNIRLRATTDNMPVAFYTAYRAEIIPDSWNPNILDNSPSGELTLTFNTDNRFEDITIPTLTIRDSERFGIDGLNISDTEKLKYVVDKTATSDDVANNTDKSTVVLSLDNKSNYSLNKRQRYAFFTGVINSSEQATSTDIQELIPNGDTIPDNVRAEDKRWNKPRLSNLFGFHVIDKIMELNHISWAYMSGIPYYKPAEAEKNGKAVTMLGLLAGKMYNGITEFSQKKVGSFDIDITTVPGCSEDDMPTKRYITGSTNANSVYYNWEHYLVGEQLQRILSSEGEPEVLNPDYKSTGSETQQYVPLLPYSMTMDIEDASSCQIVEEIYGGMTVEIQDDSINDCRNRRNCILHVAAQNTSGEDIAYFLYSPAKDVQPASGEEEEKLLFNYPVNYVDAPGEYETYYQMKKEINANDKFENVYKTVDETKIGDGYKLFAYMTNKETLISTAYDGLESEMLDENDEVTTICKYFNLEENSDYNRKSISTTGLFKGGNVLPIVPKGFSGEFYIVARTSNECRAISPIYAYIDIWGSIVVGIIHSKVEAIEEGGGGGDEPTPDTPDEPTPDEGGDDVTPDSGDDSGEGGDDSGDDNGDNTDDNTETTDGEERRSVMRSATRGVDGEETEQERVEEEGGSATNEGEGDGDESGEGGEEGGESGEEGGEDDEPKIECKPIDSKVVGFYILNAGQDYGDVEKAYYLNYYDYELNGICELDASHVINETGIVEAAMDSTEMNALFVNVTDETYDIISSYLIRTDMLGYLHRQILADNSSILVTDVTGLKHNVCISPEIEDMKKMEWNAVQYRPNGGYWPNPLDPEDTSDILFKTKLVSTETESYPLCGFFGVPLPTQEMIEAEIGFAGWREIEEGKLYKCEDTEPIVNDGPKIFDAKWVGPYTILWLADETEGGHFGEDESETECEQELTSADAGTPQECPCGEPVSSRGWPFDYWECIEECDEVTIDEDGKVTTDHSCTIIARWITKVYVTFNVAQNVGIWTDDETNTDYVMEVDRNSTVSCDRETEPVNSEQFEFVGWNEDSTALTGVNEFTVGSDDVTVYAIYKAKSAIIWLADEDNGGYFTDEDENVFTEYTQYMSGELPQTHECPVGIPLNSQRWIFNGWEKVEGDVEIDEEDNTKVIANGTGTVKATWIKVWPVHWLDDGPSYINATFNVSENSGKWSDDGTTADYTISVEENSSVTCSRIPVNQNEDRYEFVGWNTDKTATTGSKTVSVADTDITFYAIFKEKTSITWQADSQNQGYFNDATHSTEFVQYISSSQASMPQICPKGSPLNGQDWTFNGWLLVSGSAEISGDYVTPNTSCTVKPMWIRKVNITFNVSENNGKWLPDNSTENYIMRVDENSGQLTCDKTTVNQQSGMYDFIGWNTDKTATTGSYEVTVGTADKVVYAIYKLRESIVWDADETEGGYFEDATHSSVYTYYMSPSEIGVPQTCVGRQPLNRNGWRFGGWECVENCDGVVISETGESVTTDHTCRVKAIWIKKWTVQWKNGGVIE